MWYDDIMKELLNFDKVDPLFWLWALLGAVVLIVLGVLISWFWGKPVVKFFIDGQCETIVPIARGEKVVVPIELSEYSWFLDKNLKSPFPKELLSKKRVLNLYTSKGHVIGGVEN